MRKSEKISALVAACMVVAAVIAPPGEVYNAMILPGAAVLVLLLIHTMQFTGRSA